MERKDAIDITNEQSTQLTTELDSYDFEKITAIMEILELGTITPLDLINEILKITIDPEIRFEVLNNKILVLNDDNLSNVSSTMEASDHWINDKPASNLVSRKKFKWV